MVEPTEIGAQGPGDEDIFPGAVVIASEALTESGKWQAVPEHSVTTISDNKTPDCISL